MRRIANPNNFELAAQRFQTAVMGPKFLSNFVQAAFFSLSRGGWKGYVRMDKGFTVFDLDIYKDRVEVQAGRDFTVNAEVLLSDIIETVQPKLKGLELGQFEVEIIALLEGGIAGEMEKDPIFLDPTTWWGLTSNSMIKKVHPRMRVKQILNMGISMGGPPHEGDIQAKVILEPG